MTKIIFGRVVVRGGAGSELPPEGCTSAARRLSAEGYTPAGWRLHVCCLLNGCTLGRGCPAALKGAQPSLFLYPPPPPIMWDDISPENSKLLVYSTVLGVPIGLKITGGGEHSFVPPKDLTFLCLCTLEEFRADHREARLLIRTPPPWILQQEQTWDSNSVQCFTLLPFGENERSTDIRHFITSQPPFLFEYCKPMIPLAVGDKICMLNACPCMLDFTDFV
jgi:hypothetical protein